MKIVPRNDVTAEDQGVSLGMRLDLLGSTLAHVTHGWLDIPQEMVELGKSAGMRRRQADRARSIALKRTMQIPVVRVAPTLLSVRLWRIK